MTVAGEPERLRPEVLSRLLLLHSVVADLPETEAVFRFACRGLEGVPGLGEIDYSLGEGPGPGPGPASANGWSSLVLERGGRCHGTISFRVCDATAYRLYEPFIRNLAVVLTVLLEERCQRDENERYRQQLEQLVEDRTHEIQRTRRELDRLFSHSIDMLCVATVRGELIEVNPAWTAVLGWTEDELKAMSFFDLLHPDDVASTGEAAAALARGEPAVGFVNRYRCKDGDYRWLSWNTFPSPDEGLLFGVGRDVTEDKRAEKERQRLEALLRQSQKMEAIGTLAGGIAHDFNNILGAILGFSELVREHLAEGSPDHQHLSEVVSAATRAKDLTRQILMFSRRAAPGRQLVKVHLIAEEVSKLLRSTIPTSVQLQVDLDRGADSIRADPTQIHQVLMNLCTNAFHALEDELGRIQIRLETEVVDSRTAELHPDLEVGRYVVLTVSDSGTGIPAEDLPRIFEPFFSTKGPGKGTGMGLAVVHGIVQSHGGAIEVESSEGEGTSFRVYLPSVGAEPSDERSEGEALEGGAERILFIDDEEPLVRIAMRNLGDLGYSVVGTTSPSEGLTTFRGDPAAFDLVITDQTMPGIRGEHLAAEVLRLRPDVPVIICTGHSATLDRPRAMELGVRDLLMKPILRRDLAVAVRAALDGRPSGPGSSSQG